nr:MAG TPA: hypothetical protein [Caudoviricetes sp.]
MKFPSQRSHPDADVPRTGRRSGKLITSAYWDGWP